MGSLKALLRQRLIDCPTCYAFYTHWKYKFQNLFALRYFIYDARNVWRSMYWGKDAQMHPTQLQAKLLFYYHKIEKGLSMPGHRRLFGLEVIPQVTRLLTTWEHLGNSLQDPIYVGAVNSLRAYRNFILNEKIDPSDKIFSFVNDFLSYRAGVSSAEITPIIINKTQIDSTVTYDDFKILCEVRRSARDFDTQKVPAELIERAVQLAQLSPSACNRQPCKVYAVEDVKKKERLLSHQNGNAGFGHLAPLICVITVNENHFFGAIERNQPYIDGGLFSMSLLYALQAQGLVSCCLNWCVTPATDIATHKLLDIPSSERIVMYIAAGFPVAETVVPKSHRKAITNALVFK